jgi:hypothetical protein
MISVLLSRSAGVFLIALLMITAGCGARKEYVVTRLDVVPRGWDSVQVDVGFAWNTLLSGRHPIAPEAPIIRAFDASYDTLYSGSDTLFALPDTRLGDRERVLFEVCGTFGLQQVCEQALLNASPKRVRFNAEIDYPLENDPERGTYDLPYVVERRVFGSEEDDAWEQFDFDRRLTGTLKASVVGTDDVAIQIPFSRQQGRFSFTQYPNHKDFRFYLDSELFDHREATVRFSIFTDLDGRQLPAATLDRQVRKRGREERVTEVASFAEQAANQVIARLNPYMQRRRSVAYIDHWSYNPLRKTYTIDMELQWSTAHFVSSHYSLVGTLEVGEGGLHPVFSVRDGDNRARRRWRTHLREETLQLDNLVQPETLE